MANLGQKGGVFHVRFRFHCKEYKKSLQTRERSAAEAAVHIIEFTIHRVHTGQTQVPTGVDPGDFVVSGGTLLKPIAPPAKVITLPSTRALTEEYALSQKDLLAPSYHYSQVMHLRHVLKHFGDLADSPSDKVGFRDLDHYLKVRLAERHPNTVERERITLLHFCKWALKQGYVTASPAAGVTPIKGVLVQPDLEDRPV